VILVEEKRRRNECDEKGAKGERREREQLYLERRKRREEDARQRRIRCLRGTGCWQREQPRSAKLPRYRATPCCAPVK